MRGKEALCVEDDLANKQIEKIISVLTAVKSNRIIHTYDFLHAARQGTVTHKLWAVKGSQQVLSYLCWWIFTPFKTLKNC